MKNQNTIHAARIDLGVIILSLLILISPGSAWAQFNSGNVIFFDDDGTREELFNRLSSTACPASAAPDEDTWITINSATLDATNAKAAIVFGHAIARQDGVGEFNGITTFLSKDASTGPSPENQLVHTVVALPFEVGDDHSMMIIALDANKDFKVRYNFGGIPGFGPGADETQLCGWATRIQLVGWIEGVSVKAVSIDIKPGSDPNSINLLSGGVIPVAILTTPEFDASTVDISVDGHDKLSFTGASAKMKGKSGRYASFEDVDGDGDNDLVIHFYTSEIDPSLFEVDGLFTYATITGQTVDGTPISGRDTINIVKE